ncbi:hypothetical protein KSP40_PGU018570 [Platanthera guangdongensis]|uniref:Ribosomal protein L36 n=1 Tax=Platanthera guangdongensis TaxID=2320717 RepID=A0ABR2MUG1_9ASPA
MSPAKRSPVPTLNRCSIGISSRRLSRSRCRSRCRLRLRNSERKQLRFTARCQKNSNLRR